ncbi:MAG TPA: hypothetical protein VN515_01375 [Terriglobales bacterium]|nr:hypothetical protein [Terriglobales bacterium]
MPSINLRQLRDTRQLKRWLKAGQTVELRERDQVFAKIVPVGPEPRGPLPDFGARTQAIFGNRKVPSSKLLLAERRSSRF